MHEAPKPQAQGQQPGRWTLRLIQENVALLQDYSLSGIYRLLKQARIVWRTAYLRQWSPDPQYQSKLAHLCSCLQEAARNPEEVVLVFMDEAGFNRWPTPAKTWAEARPQKAPLAYHDGENNNTQWRIIAGLNPLTGQVTYLTNYIVGRKQVLTWYDQLNQTYPQTSKIWVAQDNWSIHTHPDVLEGLKQWPRIQPVWLPTYSPWLNPIEKLWRYLKCDILKMHRLSHDWKELKHQVCLFLDQFQKGDRNLLRYVGLLGQGKLACALTVD